MQGKIGRRGGNFGGGMNRGGAKVTHNLCLSDYQATEILLRYLWRWFGGYMCLYCTSYGHRTSRKVDNSVHLCKRASNSLQQK